jgi:hypothetical protein
MNEKIIKRIPTSSEIGHIEGEPNPQGVIDFIPLDEDERNWRIDFIDPKCMGFFKEVWPYMTMGDLEKMPSYRMPQVLWSAYGYGVKCLVKGDAIW